jgi:hypothetical protein
MFIAIVGAGMAGLSAAEALTASGHKVRVFDKGRGPGGRMSTRRAETSIGQVRFDHGAPSFIAETPAFAAVIEAWIAKGVAAKWTPRHVEISETGQTKARTPSPKIVGVPGMNGIIRAMAEPHSVEWGRRVSGFSRMHELWTLMFEDGSTETGFDAVIIATPIEQARDLHEAAGLGAASGFAPHVKSKAVWALMLAFDRPVGVNWELSSFTSGPLGWLARNASKPERGEAETWVAHASDAWSLTNLERDKDDIATDLAAAAVRALGGVEPIYKAAHRWRYSQLEQASDVGSLWYEAQNIGFCGDWCLGPNIEDAWQSGRDISVMIGTSQ